MKVVLFDYGTGNLHSLRKALERNGARVMIGAAVRGADALVLPGVGAFGAAAARLEPHAERLRASVDDGLPVLGICLGMQLLLDSSEEGVGAGLGLIPGAVRRLEARRVPHMGWNTVSPSPASRLFAGLEAERFYFANSFAAYPRCDEDVTARVAHEDAVFPAAIGRDHVYGTQFHPEKSGAAGLRLLGNFLELAR